MEIKYDPKLPRAARLRALRQQIADMRANQEIIPGIIFSAIVKREIVRSAHGRNFNAQVTA
jgi:hypothetical protein